jgi:hypothetical protein
MPTQSERCCVNHVTWESKQRFISVSGKIDRGQAGRTCSLYYPTLPYPTFRSLRSNYFLVEQNHLQVQHPECA